MLLHALDVDGLLRAFEALVATAFEVCFLFGILNAPIKCGQF